MQEKSNSKLVLIMLVYLAGIFMGAIDTGIVTPAREIIQNAFGVNSKDGVWMITIYTLAYAASIPIMGKLADRIGRKTIYLISISLFGIGSLFCGLSEYTGNFWLFIVARAIQAIGGGGIIPIATAEFGTAFPPAKRGMALGLVGATYGVANIFGSVAGSGILDIFGIENWAYIFYVNIPITIFILIGGFFALPNNRDNEPKKIDVAGILVLTAMVLSLLYGLKNIDYFDFIATFTSTSVYPYLIVFVLLLPIFIVIERKAQDPVLTLKYFTNRRIVVTFLVSFAAGFVLMGIVFIPQFCENSLKIPAGTGGYFVVILALLSGVSAMLSGKMLDKYGAVRVLQLGFVITIVGSLYLYFLAAPNPTLFNVVISLMLLGLGLGFTLGAPTNYMILENIEDKEASSGMAAVSLIRSIGTTIAPAIMVGFIAHAGTSVQTDIMDTLPNEVKMPTLPYAEEISAEFEKLMENPNLSDKLKGMEVADFATMETIKIDMSNDSELTIPQEMLDKFQASDVTNITTITKEFASTMFNEMSPELITDIQEGIKSGIDGIASGISEIETGIPELQSGIDGIQQGITGMQSGLKQQKNALADQAEMTTLLAQMQTLHDAIPEAFDKAKADYLAEIDSRNNQLESTYQSTLNTGYQDMFLVVTGAAVGALFSLLFYRKKRSKVEIQEAQTE